MKGSRTKNSLAACTLFGIAAITKFSAVGIFVSCGLVGLVWVLKKDERQTGQDREFARLRKLIFLSILLGVTLHGVCFDLGRLRISLRRVSRRRSAVSKPQPWNDHGVARWI